MHDYSSSSGSADEALRPVTVQPQRAHSAQNLQAPARSDEQQVPPLPHYDELRHMSPPPDYTHDDPSAYFYSQDSLFNNTKRPISLQTLNKTLINAPIGAFEGER